MVTPKRWKLLRELASTFPKRQLTLPGERAFMRVLIGIGGGVAVGLLFLLQALGTAHWCPGLLFSILHLPSGILAFALSLGTTDLVRPPPYVVVVQWIFLGALAGAILHSRQHSKASALATAVSQQPGVAPAPKTAFSTVRVISMVVGVLLLVSLFLVLWVIISFLNLDKL